MSNLSCSVSDDQFCRYKTSCFPFFYQISQDSSHGLPTQERQERNSGTLSRHHQEMGQVGELPASQWVKSQPQLPCPVAFSKLSGLCLLQLIGKCYTNTLFIETYQLGDKIKPVNCLALVLDAGEEIFDLLQLQMLKVNLMSQCD